MAELSMRDRVAAYHGDLEFVRTNRSGVVHVVQPDLRDDESQPVRLAVGLADWMLRGGPRRLTVCGLELRINYLKDGRSNNSQATPIDTFADEDTCHRCVKLLGDQSPRAFEHPRPDDPGDPDA